MFCTYLTIYKGNKLPPFYIGFTSMRKIENGYRGSVSSRQYKLIWKRELHENPHLFKTNIVKTFDSKEDAKRHETFLQKAFSVHTNPLYINMRIHGEHVLWRPHTKETRKHMSQSRRGKGNSFFGKKHTNETKKIIGTYSKGRQSKNKGVSLPEETKLKISNTLKGKMKGIPKSDTMKMKISTSKRKKIEIDGVVYSSCSSASYAFGVSSSSITLWLKKGKAKLIP